MDLTQTGLNLKSKLVKEKLKVVVLVVVAVAVAVELHHDAITFFICFYDSKFVVYISSSDQSHIAALLLVCVSLLHFA